MPAPAKKEMLSVSLRPDGTYKVRINYSSLSIIQTCMRKAMYVLDSGLMKGEESEALIFGTAVHKALESWYSSDTAARELPRNLDEIARMMAYGHVPDADHPAYTAINAFLAAGQPLRKLEDSDKRSLGNGAKILAGYLKCYHNDGLTVVRDSAGAAYVEKLVRFPLDCGSKHEIEFFGTIDAILENKATGMIAVTDHKTTSQLGSSFFNRLKPNHQYTGYLLGANRVLGLDTNIFMINGIQVCKTKQQYARQFTDRSPADFAEFTLAVTDAVHRYIRALETGRWPQSAPDPCTNWGGCEFIKACEVPAALKDSVIRATWGDKAVKNPQQLTFPWMGF